MEMIAAMDIKSSCMLCFQKRRRTVIRVGATLVLGYVLLCVKEAMEPPYHYTTSRNVWNAVTYGKLNGLPHNSIPYSNASTVPPSITIGMYTLMRCIVS